MLLVGNIGVGKSIIGNIILGYFVFNSSVFVVFIIVKIQYNEMLRFCKRIVVVDMFGYFDIKCLEKEILKELIKWYFFVFLGIYVIVFVV